MIKSKIILNAIRYSPAFLLGAVVGGGIAAYFVKKKLQKIFDAQVKQIRKDTKKAFELKYQKKLEELNDKADALEQMKEAEEEVLINEDFFDNSEEEEKKTYRTPYSKLSTEKHRETVEDDEEEIEEEPKKRIPPPEDWDKPYEITEEEHYDDGRKFALEEITYNPTVGEFYFESSGETLDCDLLVPSIGKDIYDDFLNGKRTECYVRHEMRRTDYFVCSITSPLNYK